MCLLKDSCNGLDSNSTVELEQIRTIAKEIRKQSRRLSENDLD